MADTAQIRLGRADVALLRDSLRDLSGRDLADGLDLSLGLAHALDSAPFALVAHDAAADPTFFYGNQAALDLFEMTWDEFTSLPSRLSAGADDREERAELLRRVASDGWSDSYRGVRISSTGAQFLIEDATVWNLIDAEGTRVGQAAMIPRWTPLVGEATTETATATADDFGPGIVRLTALTAPDLAVGVDATAVPVVRALTRDELDLALDWCGDPGLGLHDADTLWACDSRGLLGVELDGVLVGAGAAVAHARTLGHIGLLVVRPELRRRGLAHQLLPVLVDDVRSRLDDGAPITIDCPESLAGAAAELGFVSTQRLLRAQGTGGELRRGPHAGELRALSTLPLDVVVDYDARHVGAAREDLLRAWIAPKNGLALGVYEARRLQGMGVLRPSASGFTLGPWYADEPSIAEELLTALLTRAGAAQVTIDLLDGNSDARTLVDGRNFRVATGRVHMILGDAPDVAAEGIYGVTSYEFG